MKQSTESQTKLHHLLADPCGFIYISFFSNTMYQKMAILLFDGIVPQEVTIKYCIFVHLMLPHFYGTINYLLDSHLQKPKESQSFQTTFIFAQSHHHPSPASCDFC